jgi:hypothetical protein
VIRLSRPISSSGPKSPQVDRSGRFFQRVMMRRRPGRSSP